MNPNFEHKWQKTKIIKSLLTDSLSKILSLYIYRLSLWFHSLNAFVDSIRWKQQKLQL